MCESCGLSGCRHDWQKWQPEAFQKGYESFLTGEESPYPRDGYNQKWLAFVCGWNCREADEDRNAK